MRLRIIGDVHGNIKKYLEIVEDANAQGLHTLQIGDLGFYPEYQFLFNYKSFDKDKNKCFMGNHDCYTLAEEAKSSFCLGDYGPATLNGVSFFFVRGAFSIDQFRRTHGIDWWPEEELPLSEFDKIAESYLKCKPDIVISHDCPHSIGNDEILKEEGVLEHYKFNPNTFTTNTSALLQQLFSLHQPQFWYFGHYHKNWTNTVRGTKFRCLAELSYIDI
ncbi:MAG: metallophosphoesterase [Crenarchaeota archaeon]|nr:MAG: metallophosphoesterase [Thermoproteota archaeon]